MALALRRRSFAALAAPALLASRAGWAADTVDSLVEGAKKEGKLVAWIVAPRLPATQRALITAFNKRFGLRTELEWVPNPPISSDTRAIAEAGGGSVSVDIIGGANIDGVDVVTRAGLVKPYPWSDVFGAAMPAIKTLEARVIPKFRGDALPYQEIVYGLCWNPDSIAEADLPSKLTDLADPKWHGKFAFNSFLSPMEIVANLIGPEATMALTKAIFANEPVFARGTPAVASAVATGSVPFGLTVSPVAAAMERQHAKLSFRLFSDIIPVSLVFLYVPDLAPHPNTARLFTAWLAAEGAPVADPFEPSVAPGDPNATTEKMIAAATASGAKIAEVHTVEEMEAGAKTRDTLLALMNGQK